MESNSVAGGSSAVPLPLSGSVKHRYRGYAQSDLKMLENEALAKFQTTETKQTAPASNRPVNPNFHVSFKSATASPTTLANHISHTPDRTTVSGNQSSQAPSKGWKVGVASDRTLMAKTYGGPNSSPTSDVFGDDDPLMKTLMPASNTGTSPSVRAQIGLRTPAKTDSKPLSSDSPSVITHAINFESDEDEYEEDMDQELDEVFALETEQVIDDTLPSEIMTQLKPVYQIQGNIIDSTEQQTNTATNKRDPSKLLGPPPKNAASPPPHPTYSHGTVPAPPPTPSTWSKSPQQSNSVHVHLEDAPLKPSMKNEVKNFQASNFNMSTYHRPRSISAQGLRKTYAGTEEEIGLVRRSELAGLPMPNFRKDYQVSILIQYSESSKDIIEYKNRVHPECVGSDIITECVSKTRRKVPNWIPPIDRFAVFELVIPARTDEDDDILMGLDTPCWKYCFIPGEVTRLVLRPKIRINGTRIALKVRMDRGPIRTMIFNAITPVGMVIERIQHKAKGVESRGPPFTGLFVFDNKRGHFLENVNKTIGEYHLKDMDIIQIKRRRLMEICLKDQPNRNLMVPTDLTAQILAEQLHDWLRLDPISDSSSLSLVRIVPSKGTSEELQLVLNPNTEVRSFHLFKGDIIQLRKKISFSPSQGSEKHEVLRSSLKSSTPAHSVKVNPPSINTSLSSPALKPNGLQSSEQLQASAKPGESKHIIIETFQIAFAGSNHDSESFGHLGPGLNFMPGGVGGARRNAPPKLKLGEVGLFQTIYGINLWDSSVRMNMCGDLHITNYRLYFSSFSDDTNSDYMVDVPLTSISRTEKIGDKNKPGLKIDCKDFRTLRFHFDKSNKDSRRQLKRTLEECLFPNMKQLFAFAYKSARSNVQDPQRIDGWDLLDLHKEFTRLGVGVGDKGSKWRVSRLNEFYTYSKTYPAFIAVPASVSDEELVPVFKYRSKGRLPALSWLNSRTGASITRCSQPLSGVTKKTSLDDANLINAIREAQGSADTKLHLLDARPRANAIANMAMGGGFEVMGGSAYSGCDLEFLNIGNIHVMRNSLADLKSLIEDQPYDSGFLAKLENTGWLLHISLLLQGAVKIVEHIQQRHSCVLHCSDGWDRTSQLSSIAMILLDPYYRTTLGLCVLIEKEWCSFGHKFAQRYGHIAVDHVDKNYAHGERAPIFLQFIDCVYQVLRQFPCAFEYTENVLLAIMEHLYSCHFGTFLFDCERERKAQDLRNKTESLWTFLLAPENNDQFKNIFYEPFDSVLPLAPTLADIQLWRSYYRRWYAPPEEDKMNVECKVKELFTQTQRQAERIKELEAMLMAKEKSKP